MSDISWQAEASERSSLTLATGTSLWCLQAWSLAKREVVRFLRQRGQIIGALVTPLVFWLLLGSGFARSVTLSEDTGLSSYTAFFFPGAVVMVVLFASIFSMISIIEDRREGFMQAVLAAPVSRSAIVAGKILGSTILAAGQGTLFLVLAPLAGVNLSLQSFLQAAAILCIIAAGLSGVGFVFAWRSESTRGFHAVMNLVLNPMWFASGAVFPLSGAAGWIQYVMYLNPLTYGVTAFRGVLHGGKGPLSTGASLMVAIAFAIVMMGLATVVVNKRAKA